MQIVNNHHVGTRAEPFPPVIGFEADEETSPRLVSFEVVVAARAGNQAALSQACAEVYPRLAAFYRYSGLTAQESEDVAADAIEDVITHLPRLRRPRSFDAWIWSIGRSRLRGFIRKNRRPSPIEPVAPEGPGPEEQLITGEEHSQIRTALATLSERDRELLWLSEVEGLSYAEIGGRIGAATGATRVACHRARKRLEAAYRTEDEHPAGVNTDAG